MSVQSIIKAIHGAYEPTGAYSFEFVSSSGRTVSEIFFALPPGNQSVSEGQRSGIQPTLSGSYITDFGNEVKDITISGSLWFFYQGDPENPVSRDPGDAKIDGYEEYLKLRFMLIRYRDYMMTRGGKMIAPVFRGRGMTSVNALKSWVNNKIRTGEGALIDKLQLIYHDYDLDNHMYVKVENFTATQNKEDPHSIEYNISLKGYKIDDRQSGMQKKEIKLTVQEEIQKAIQDIQKSEIEDELQNITDSLSGNNSIYNLTMSLILLLKLFDDVLESILSGEGVKKSLALGPNGELLYHTVEKVLKKIVTAVENHVVPAESVDSFESGGVSAEEFFDADMMKFFNSLQKLEISNTAIKAAVQSSPVTREVSFKSGNDNYVLTTDEWENDGEVFSAEIEEEYDYYTIEQGDSLKKISVKTYGDESNWIKISQANNLRENDLIDYDFVGKKIKIPVQGGGVTRNSENQVYESNYDNPEIYVHGTDFDTDGGKVKIDKKGDRKKVSGLKCTIQNISNRLENPKGSLNPYHPNWGCLPLVSQNAPYLVNLDRALADREAQAMSDPRTVSATVDYDNLSISGNKVEARLKVELTGGYKNSFEASI